VIPDATQLLSLLIDLRKAALHVTDDELNKLLPKALRSCVVASFGDLPDKVQPKLTFSDKVQDFVARQAVGGARDRISRN